MIKYAVNIGDIAICINNQGAVLTLNKAYVVQAVRINEFDGVTTRNSIYIATDFYGLMEYFPASMFKIVDTPFAKFLYE